MVFVSPSWMLLVVVVQAVATVIVVAMLLIVPSTQAYGQCILTLADFGKAQMDLMAAGQLVAHSLYSLMLALDTIVNMHATGLYFLIAFVLDGTMQGYQHQALEGPCMVSGDKSGYFVAAVSVASWLGLVALGLVSRRQFHAPLSATQSACLHVIKLDFYWLFLYSTTLLPLAQIEPSATALIEPPIYFCVSLLFFMAMWATQAFLSAAQVLAALVLSVAVFFYTGYQLVRFAIAFDSVLRYRLIFLGVTCMMGLLMAISVLIAWLVQLRRQRQIEQQQQQQQQAHQEQIEANGDQKKPQDAELFLTPYNTRDQ